MTGSSLVKLVSHDQKDLTFCELLFDQLQFVL